MSVAEQTIEDKVPCISIKQPFATWVVEGRKKVELRNWITSLRGRVLVHASKGEVSSGIQINGGNYPVDTMPKGCIIGAVTVTGVRPVDDALLKLAMVDNADFKYAWMLEYPEKFAEWIAFRGMPGIFYVPGWKCVPPQG